MNRCIFPILENNLVLKMFRAFAARLNPILRDPLLFGSHRAKYKNDICVRLRGSFAARQKNRSLVSGNPNWCFLFRFSNRYPANARGAVRHSWFASLGFAKTSATFMRGSVHFLRLYAKKRRSVSTKDETLQYKRAFKKKMSSGPSCSMARFRQKGVKWNWKHSCERTVDQCPLRRWSPDIPVLVVMWSTWLGFFFVELAHARWQVHPWRTKNTTAVDNICRGNSWSFCESAALRKHLKKCRQIVRERREDEFGMWTRTLFASGLGYLPRAEI